MWLRYAQQTVLRTRLKNISKTKSILYFDSNEYQQCYIIYLSYNSLSSGYNLLSGLPFCDTNRPAFLGDPNILSTTAPILEAYDMSPLTIPNSSLGYSLKKVPFNTGISEAESAASFLMNETFDSSPAVSPDVPSQYRNPQISDDDEFSFQDVHQQSANGYLNPRNASSSTSSSHLSAPSSSTFLSATNSSTAFDSSGPSSSSLSSFHTSSASSFSNQTSSSNSFSTSLGSSGSDNLFSSSASSEPISDIISSAFMSATQNPVPSSLPISFPSFHNVEMMMGQQHQFHQEQQIMPPHIMHLDHLAAPLPMSPIGFAPGLPHLVSSTPIVMGNIQ